MDGTSKGFATFSGGLFWAMDDEAGMQKAFLGASLMNFNQPNVSFVGDDAKLPSAFQATAGVRVVKTERFSVMPTGRYITTAGNDQINLGSWFRYHLLGTNDAGFVRQGSLGIGAWYDTNKAMVLSAEFNQPNYLISVSFDVPTSSDVNAFQRGSVFEIAAALKLNKFRPKQPEGKDTDGDGVFDETDACPETPGKKEFNGCPDTDNDGIPDNFDACPSEAGLKNFAGCPDKDNDGVQDKEDACPDVAGSKATNGCPDRDGDGVADSEDACPDQPGLKSNKGCPPAEREIVQVSPEELKILETAKYVHFETGTAVIDRTSYGILDLVVEVMKHHKEDILDLDGHTDNVGDAEKNKQLGQERADAVKAYLVSKGVAGSQITTESQGEEKPVANNETEEGRSLNRRVEMMILKKK
jgi:outer membrane protein OmpA-like peptidoglycan-associated protein